MQQGQPNHPGGSVSYTRANAAVRANSDRRRGTWLSVSAGVFTTILALWSNLWWLAPAVPFSVASFYQFRSARRLAMKCSVTSSSLAPCPHIHNHHPRKHECRHRRHSNEICSQTGIR